MVDNKRAFSRVLAALLIGLIGVVSTLLLLSQGASARPMLDEIDLSISKSANADHVQVGNQLIYSLTYQVSSTDTVNIVITDTLDPRLIYVGASITPSVTGNVCYWSIGPLSGSVTDTIVLTTSIPMTLPNGTTITNNVTIASTGATSDSDQITTTADAPTLELTKRDYTDPVPAGAPLTYTLAYSNTGDADATHVVITDVLDSNVTFVSASLTPTTWSTPTLYWNIGTLTHPVSGKIIISVTVASGLSGGIILTNTATIDSQQIAPFSRTVTTTVTSHGDPTSVTLTPATHTITAGQSVSYTLTAYDIYGNDWDVTSGGTYTITPGAGGSWDTNVYTSEVVNTWSVTGTYSSHHDTATLTVTHADAVSVTLTPAVATIAAGQSVSYTLTATDTFGNEWDATSSGAYTITPGAGGVWADNRYTSQIADTWTVTGTYQGTDCTATLTVEPGVLDHFGFDLIITQTAGSSFDATITAYDAYNNLKTDYTATAALTDTTQTIDPTTTTGGFSAGIWTSGVTITRTGSAVVITVTDGITSDGSTPFTVTPTILDHFTFDPFSSPQTAGDPFDVTIRAYDRYDNLKTDYTATAALTDTTQTIDPTTTTGGFSAGIWTSGVTITRTGSAVVITVTDGITSDDSTPFTVIPTTLDHFTFDPFSSPQTAGDPFDVTIRAYDRYDNLKTNYTATAALTDTTQTIDPTTTTGGFSAGVWTGNVTITRTGSAVVITAIDDPVSDPSDPFTVNPAELDHIILSPATSTIYGWQSQAYTVQAFDRFDNSRGDVTAASDYSIVEPGHGGAWTDNVYTPIHYGDWTVHAIYTGTQVTTDTADLLVRSPVLHISKGDEPDPVEVGDPLTYTLTYSNTGNWTATNVVVTDTLDPNVSYVAASPPPDGGLPSAPFWNIGSIGIGATGEIVITVTVARPLTNNTALTNAAWLNADWVGGGQSNPLSATENTTAHSRPVLTIVKTDSRDPVTAGGLLQYTIVITNSGNENATSVTVTELYDPNVSYLTANPSPDSGDNVWIFPVLPVDHSESIDVFVQVDGVLPVGSVLTNQVTLDSDQTTPTTVTETTAVTSVSELTVYKLDTPDPVQAGGDLMYIITYQTSGSAPADDVVITETYDSHVTFISANPTPKAGTDNVWEIGDLGVNESGNIIVTVQVDTPLANGTMLTNVVTIDSALTSPQTYTETTTVSSTPELAFHITDQPDPVEAGDPLTYTLHYRNDGNADATQVVVTATLDANVSYDTAWPAPTGGADDVWYWELGEIAGEGGEGEIVIYTTVTLPLPNGTLLDLAAQLEDAEGDSLESTAQTTVASAPILHLHKSANAPTVQAGDLLTYTITYSNTGNETATNFVPTEAIDPNTIYESASISPSVWVSDTLFYWNIGNLTPTVSGQITLCVRVRSPLPNNTILVNTVTIDSDQTTPQSVQEETEVRSAPILHLTKSDSSDPIQAGSILTYTITYSNTGNEISTHTVITDLLDSNVTLLSADPPDLGSGRTRYWNIGNLTPTVSGQITLCVRVHSPLPNHTILANTVTIDSDRTAPQSVQEETEVHSAPILHLAKFDSPDPVQAGSILTYTITYSNTGNETSTHTVITDILDAHVTLLSADPPAFGSGRTRYWDIGDFAPNDPRQITLRVWVHSPLTNNTILTNTVTIDNDQTAPQSVQEETEVHSAPILHLAKFDSPDPVQAGSILTYTITYSNTGNETSTHTVITDILDAHVTLLSADPPALGSGRTRYWDIADLVPNAPGQITLRVAVTLPLTNGTILTNTAFLNSDQTITLSAVETSTVESAPILSLDKDDGVSIVYAGDTLTYTLTYTNSGNENAYDVTITDTLPSYVEYVGCDIPDGDCQRVQPDGDEVVFHIPTLVAQTYGQAHLVVRIDDPLPARAAFVINHARMTAQSLAVPIHEEDIDPIGTRPDLAVKADHAPSIFSPGQLMTFTITFGNAGRMHAENVIITTTLPTNTVYVGSSGWYSSGGRIYTCTVGQLPAGDTGHTITFTVEYTKSTPQQIGVPEFNISFTIAEEDNIGEDANPDDNTANAYIGVPDLIVIDFTVEPFPLEPDVPVTFTIVLKNQGAGMAWNPDNESGFYVDVFIATIDSYPWKRYSEINVYGGSDKLAPGEVYSLVLTHRGFSEQELEEIPGFYVKVDNHKNHPYGQVPESDEMNNLGAPILLLPHRIYLPLIQR